MVYTVTFNPAIDLSLTLDSLCEGRVNRCSSESLTFGGKGINVSAVLSELGTQTKALGFCAGFTGQAIVQGLEKAGIGTDFVQLSGGNSRINVKVKAEKETEINGRGPDISDKDLEKLFDKLSALGKGDVLVLAGSVPASVSRSIYSQILERLSGRGILFVLDAEGELLLDALRFEPFVIKPNIHELGQLFGVQINSDAETEKYAKLLQERGAKNVLVSMAKDGSLLLDENGKMHRMGVCKGEVVSSVGAGDSMLAGFISGYLSTGDYSYALRLATACGGATAFSQGTAKKELIDQLLKQI